MKIVAYFIGIPAVRTRATYCSLTAGMLKAGAYNRVLVNPVLGTCAYIGCHDNIRIESLQHVHHLPLPGRLTIV